MVALAAALGIFHIPQQTVHFRQGQAPIGAHGTMTGHGPEQFVQMRLDAIAGAVLHQVRQHILHQPVGFGLLEQGRNLADGDTFRPQPGPNRCNSKPRR